jgi:YHS domain-containing protein
MKRLFGLIVMVGVVALVAEGLTGTSKAAPTADQKKAKEKLQELHEFIGQFNGNGGPDKAKTAPNELWKETVNWGWKFKGDDTWLTVEFKDGRLFKSGEMRYLPTKNKYEFTVIGKDDKKRVFEGDLKNETLTLEYVDPETKETQQLVMNTVSEGVRFIYRFNRKAAGSTILKKEFIVTGNRDGESFAAAKGKGNICVVSGGVGTWTVSYKGETFYVCCSGCRDAFNENPEKYIKEFKAKVKK